MTKKSKRGSGGKIGPIKAEEIWTAYFKVQTRTTFEEEIIGIDFIEKPTKEYLETVAKKINDGFNNVFEEQNKPRRVGVTFYKLEKKALKQKQKHNALNSKLILPGSNLN